MSESPPRASEENSERPPTAIEVWLRHEHLPKAERLDRLAGDAELEASLRAHGFEGDDWDFFVNVLAEYGVGVIGGWVSRRVIVQKCAEKRIRVPSLPEHVTKDYDAVTDIATDTVAEAINFFRDDVLVPGIWDPAKGASLRTFFIGQCMRRYANVARRWLNHEQRPVEEEATDDLGVLNEGRVSNVEDDAVRTVTAQHILRGVSSPRAARALAMDALKFRNAEIAADLGVSVDAVSSLLKRARADIRKNQEHIAERGRTS